MSDLQLELNHSRSFGGLEKVTSINDLDVWKKISHHYGEIDISDIRGMSLRFSINWQPRVTYEERLCMHYNDPERLLTPGIEKFKFEHVHVCPLRILSDIQGSLFTMEPLILRALNEIYLLANLASPGSFNLYRSYLTNPRLDQRNDPLAKTALDLSEYLFENSLHEAQTSTWLKVGFISFDHVHSWYNSLGMREKNSASTPIERTLFCLLHLGKVSFMEPTATLWLASALESLFETPSGSSFSFLCSRISSLLALQDSEHKELKKKLRDFFGIRHAFVHGGSEVWHPVLDERDNRLDKIVSDLLMANGFACSILVGCVQELVRRGWKGLRFEERIEAAQ